jgi:hypothetical protein
VGAGAEDPLVEDVGEEGADEEATVVPSLQAARPATAATAINNDPWWRVIPEYRPGARRRLPSVHRNFDDGKV